LLVPAAYALAAYLQFSGNTRQDHLASREQSSRSLPSLPHGLEVPPLPNVSFHASHYTIKQKYCHSIMRDSVRGQIKSFFDEYDELREKCKKLVGKDIVDD
jgi:hypothetical protein